MTAAPNIQLVRDEATAGLIPGPWYVAWRLVPEHGKVPYVAPEQKANVWTDGPFLTFEQASALAARVGVVFSASHSLVGVDVDACRDPASGAVLPWAADLVAPLGEPVVTPSGTGV